MANSSVPDMDAATIKASNLLVKRTANHVYFFGYEGPDPEVCFQQWFPSPFTDSSLDGSPNFSTSEHYMMYRMALLFGDETVAKKILTAETPGEAKTLGRQAGYVYSLLTLRAVLGGCQTEMKSRPFNQSKWDSSCDEIVERGNYLKFSQSPKLKVILLNTGSKVIVEVSPSDSIWGIGFDAEHTEGNEDRWGANKLGKALMRARESLRD